jgi:hypothetical protein
VLKRILDDLLFHLNLDLEIFNKLGMIIIITLFYIVKALSLFHSMNYTQTLLINLWLIDSQYFSMTLHNQ